MPSPFTCKPDDHYWYPVTRRMDKCRKCGLERAAPELARGEHDWRDVPVTFGDLVDAIGDGVNWTRWDKGAEHLWKRLKRVAEEKLK